MTTTYGKVYDGYTVTIGEYRVTVRSTEVDLDYTRESPLLALLVHTALDYEFAVDSLTMHLEQQQQHIDRALGNVKDGLHVSETWDTSDLTAAAVRREALARQLRGLAHAARKTHRNLVTTTTTED